MPLRDDRSRNESRWITDHRQAVRAACRIWLSHNPSSTEAGGLARSRLLEHRDDGIYVTYALALRRHEANRQYGINTASPIEEGQPVTGCNPVDYLFKMRKIGFYELVIHCVPQ